MILRRYLEIFNKEFIVWERVSMYNKYHRGKIFILYDRFQNLPENDGQIS